MKDEDRQRAGRIAVLNDRLRDLEGLLQFAGDTKRLDLVIRNIPAAGSASFLGVEAERLIAHLIDETTGELQALL